MSRGMPKNAVMADTDSTPASMHFKKVSSSTPIGDCSLRVTSGETRNTGNPSSQYETTLKPGRLSSRLTTSSISTIRLLYVAIIVVADEPQYFGKGVLSPYGSSEWPRSDYD